MSSCKFGARARPSVCPSVRKAEYKKCLCVLLDHYTLLLGGNECVNPRVKMQTVGLFGSFLFLSYLFLFVCLFIHSFLASHLLSDVLSLKER